MTSQTATETDLLAHTTAQLSEGVDSSMASRTTLALVAAALDERGIGWTPHAQTLLVDRTDGSDLTVYWEGRWCYRVHNSDGSELESGSVESIGDVLRLACEGV